MPNWCTNNIVIQGNDSLTKKVKEIKETGSNNVMQDLLEIDGGGENWYEYNTKMFGTKWDFNYPDDSEISVYDNTIYIDVLTAWSPIINFLENLCKKYEVTAEISYSEPGADYAGTTKITPNETIDECYSFLEGLYRTEDPSFMDEIEYRADCLAEMFTPLAEFMETFDFIEDKNELDEIATIYINEIKKHTV